MRLSLQSGPVPVRPWILAAVATLALPAGALAQGSLFDKAKKALGGIEKLAPGAAGLSETEIADGLREALRVGSKRVVGQVGALDGFNADPDIHIPLPGALSDVQSALARFGMAGLADDLELRLNRGAEAAASEATDIFAQTISQMTLADARKILDGPDDAATRYFQRKMTAPLTGRFKPIVDSKLSEVGAIRAYDQMMAGYRAIPFVPDAKADLTSYVVERALDGIFHYVAKEEAAIRHDPAARTTALLKRVFGSP